MSAPGEPVVALAAFGFRHIGADRAALGDVTLEVRRGEYVAVLGATDAGVTTLLTALDGVVPQLVRGKTEGSIRVLGRDPRAVPVAEQARDVGLVFDDPDLAATQATVADEVAFGLENLGVPRSEMDARIAAALTSVGLDGCEGRDPATLSGGELQRLAIACALAMGPALLVLDEPSANLDAAGRRALYSTVRRLNREHGVTVVAADQDPEGLAADATRVVVLDRGRLVLDGDPAATLGWPAMLRRHGVRSTDAAALAEALGLPAPVPVFVAEVARCVVPRTRSSVERPSPAPEPSPSPEVLVEARGVTYRYPGAPGAAVAGVSLSVGAGEVVGIIGPNGSGKTTLARLVNGLLRPQAGRILVDGLDTATHPVQALAAHVAMVLQDPSRQLLASTVADELALGPRALGVSEAGIRERVRELATLLGLDELLGRHPLRLGRAQRKIVALGAVLAMRPRVLLLDEPTTGADARLAGIIEDRVRGAAGEGSAVVIASHDMAFLGRVASRLVVMEAGRVRADAAVRAVFADAPLLAAAGVEAPGACRVALATAGQGPERWPPVSLEEALLVLEADPGEAAPRPESPA